MPVPTWKVALGKSIGKVFPRLSLRTRLDRSELSDDPQVESRARSDRYMHGRITAPIYFGMLEAGRWCIEHALELSIPTLVMHGGKDRITRAEVSERFCREAPRCAFRLWPEGKHELHLMNDSDGVLDFTIGWLKQFRSAPAPGALSHASRERAG
jgi:alpha-beta hydrolase superfamily lysophospholipase